MQWRDIKKCDDAVEWDRNNDLQMVNLSIRLDQAIALLCKCPYIQGHSCELIERLLIEIVLQINLTYAGISPTAAPLRCKEGKLRKYLQKMESFTYSGGEPRRS